MYGSRKRGHEREYEVAGSESGGPWWYLGNEPTPLATRHPFGFLLVNQCTCSALEEKLALDLGP